ncbi:MAG: reverse transcriptase domain-containing protein [Bacilli bacterium]|nr:reverse transcriptase domain-containing protein [Bacilli bacterium]
MSKTVKNIYLKNLTFEKMYAAYIRAKKNKTAKKEVMEFEFNLEKNIIKLIKELKNNTYCTGKYREFKVYEPKERIIKSLPFRDRVVHQWYVYEFLIPYMVPKFIYDSYACLENKGTHKAIYKLEKYMKQAKNKYEDFYILKMDISKFFYNINQEILYFMIQKNFKDKYLLNLTSKLIFDSEDKIGIPIGNYTSQYFANIYLNELDQYIKNDLKIKYYLRFMDDFVLIVRNKEEAKKTFLIINNFIEKKLNLKLNHKSRYYPSSMGVDFCGYRVYFTHKLIRNRSKKQMNKNIKKWNYLYQNNKLNKIKVTRSLNSWIAHIRHANSYNLYTRYIEKIKFSV